MVSVYYDNINSSGSRPAHEDTPTTIFEEFPGSKIAFSRQGGTSCQCFPGFGISVRKWPGDALTGVFSLDMMYRTRFKLRGGRELVLGASWLKSKIAVSRQGGTSPGGPFFENPRSQVLAKTDVLGPIGPNL